MRFVYNSDTFCKNSYCGVRHGRCVTGSCVSEPPKPAHPLEILPSRQAKSTPASFKFAAQPVCPCKINCLRETRNWFRCSVCKFVHHCGSSCDARTRCQTHADTKSCGASCCRQERSETHCVFTGLEYTDKLDLVSTEPYRRAERTRKDVQPREAPSGVYEHESVYQVLIEVVPYLRKAGRWGVWREVRRRCAQTPVSKALNQVLDNLTDITKKRETALPDALRRWLVDLRQFIERVYASFTPQELKCIFVNPSEYVFVVCMLVLLQQGVKLADKVILPAVPLLKSHMAKQSIAKLSSDVRSVFDRAAVDLTNRHQLATVITTKILGRAIDMSTFPESLLHSPI